MSNDKNGRKKLVNVLAVIIILMLIIEILLGMNISESIPNKINKVETAETVVQEVDGALMVHMIDVGQGDCFLLMQDGKTALIDCGTADTSNDVIRYLNQHGITKLDYFVGSHPHDDHIGAMLKIITKFEVGLIIFPDLSDFESTSLWYENLIDELQTGKYNIEVAEVGTVYPLGVATMEVIGPLGDPEDNVNNYSIVLKASMGNNDVLFTGDAEKAVEEELALSGKDIEAEILKVGHHGSNTSSQPEFLDEVNPDYALISTGNKYGHPTKPTMEKLEERNIEVYRTDESGTVVATITSNSISFNCEPGDYLSGDEVKGR